jgi:pSer/pThr/pTyr-binding forkhead associated (FHA) protein
MNPAPQAVLLVRGGSGNGSTIALPEGMTMIGRAPLNDVILDAPGVSRQHAGLQHAGLRGDRDGSWIADLGSRNGTFVNGTAESSTISAFVRQFPGRTNPVTAQEIFVLSWVEP